MEGKGDDEEEAGSQSEAMKGRSDVRQEGKEKWMNLLLLRVNTAWGGQG